MIEKKLKITLFTLVLLLIAIPLVSANMVDDLLSPLAGVDFSQTYDSYSSIIDFFIYAILFIGLAQVTIGKRFESNGGKAMVVAIGLVLAIGLVISESVIGFNLRSFGPLAAAIFIFLVGLVIFLGIKAFGMEAVGAASITIVITYFSIRSITPGFFDWMISNPNMAWLHSVLLIAVIISVFKVIKIFFPRKDEGHTKEPKGFIESVSQKPKDFLEHIREEKEEKNFIKTKLRKITEESGKNSKHIIKDLLEIKKLIREFGNTEKGRELIAGKIKSISENEKQIHLRIQTLQNITKKLADFDIKNFTNLQSEYNKMSDMEKRKVEKRIKLDWKKLGIEKQMMLLEQAIIEYDRAFNHALELLVVSLRSNRIKSAIEQVDLALGIEKRLLKIIKQMDGLEKKLESFTKKEIKEMINTK